MRHVTAHALAIGAPASLATLAREHRPRYPATIATLTEADRDDVLFNMQEAEETLREILPEFVLRLGGAPGDEFLLPALADAMGKLSSALRAIEDRLVAGRDDRRPRSP